MNREHLKMFSHASQAGTTSCGETFARATNRFDATLLGIGHVSGALSALAIVVGHNPGDDKIENTDDFNPAARLNNDRVLFAALLAVTAFDCCPDQAQNISPGLSAATLTCNFSAESILHALTMFETLTGRKVDDQINPAMVASARDSMKDDSGVVMLSELLKRDRTTH